MGLETENATPVWIALFNKVDGSTAVQNAIGTSTVVANVAVFTVEPDALLVQATGGDIYWRMDGHPADVGSFLLKADDPPVLFPWLEDSFYSFTGADANARLVIQPVTVH